MAIIDTLDVGGELVYDKSKDWTSSSLKHESVSVAGAERMAILGNL